MDEAWRVRGRELPRRWRTGAGAPEQPDDDRGGEDEVEDAERRGEQEWEGILVREHLEREEAVAVGVEGEAVPVRRRLAPCGGEARSTDTCGSTPRGGG